jgi:hypothetical protein
MLTNVFIILTNVFIILTNLEENPAQGPAEYRGGLWCALLPRTFRYDLRMIRTGRIQDLGKEGRGARRFFTLKFTVIFKDFKNFTVNFKDFSQMTGGCRLPPPGYLRRGKTYRIHLVRRTMNRPAPILYRDGQSIKGARF